jgi:aromatic-L-amino-acid decarboxylase
MTDLKEETLDPADWDAFRALGHRMLDEMIDYLASVRERPVWQPVPPGVKTEFEGPAPRGSADPASVYEEFRKNILPYPTGNIHPRFWGWVMGTGTPMAMLADMLASGMNPHLAGYDQSASLVEYQVIRWLAELLGFPRDSSGLLVSGGTMANLIGLTVARNSRAGFDLRTHGLQHPDAPKLVFYGSTETHSWAGRAAELLGLGRSAFHRIPVAADFTVDVKALKAAVLQDRRAGKRPFCLIGNAGTVNTGATDDLPALAAISRDEGLWFHIDGAFGALAALSPELAPIVDGMEHADSIAIDLHKWGYLPFEAGCVLVRDRKAHRESFATSASYLNPTARGIVAGGLVFADLGIQLSRGFRALKVWMALKTHGADALGRLIRQNVEQARYLRDLIANDPRLELLAPVPLNVVCFRFAAPGMDPAELNALNEEILIRIQESGLAVPSGTLLGDRYAIRVAITNHRSRREDFAMLVEAVTRIGLQLVEESSTRAPASAPGR